MLLGNGAAGTPFIVVHMFLQKNKKYAILKKISEEVPYEDHPLQ